MKKLHCIVLATTLLCECVSANPSPPLREASDLNDVLDLLVHAKELKITGDMVPGQWDEGRKNYRAYVDLPLTVDSPDTIRRLAELFRGAGFMPDAEMTQHWKDGDRIGTKQHFRIVVDDKAYIYILADMLICRNHRTYSPKRYEREHNTHFAKELAMVLRDFTETEPHKAPNKSVVQPR
jgi:hypothetical protein